MWSCQLFLLVLHQLQGNLIQKESKFSSTITSNSSNSTDSYTLFQNSPKPNNVAVQVGETDLINPNGYHIIVIILKILENEWGFISTLNQAYDKGHI